LAICPRSGDLVHHVGQHLHLDLYGASNLADVAYIQKACEEASVATGATILGSNFHHFGGEYGVTGVVLLSSSHCSIHTWPEFGLACVDVFVCDGDDPSLALPIFKDRFAPLDVRWSLYKRGVLAPDYQTVSLIMVLSGLLLWLWKKVALPSKIRTAVRTPVL
jgi:S-adenosylmethionine decarboxylase